MTGSVEPTSLRAFLTRLTRERVIRLSPHLVLSVEALLAARRHADPRELAAAIASLSTHSPERWRAVYRRSLDFLAANAAVGPPDVRIGAPASAAGEPKSSAHRRRKRPRRFRRRTLVACVVTALALSILIVALLATRRPSGSTAHGDDGADAANAPHVDPPPERPRRPLLPLTSGLLVSASLLVLGAHWLLSPIQRRQRLHGERAMLRGESRGSHVIYHVPRHEPFSTEIMDAAASLLGRSPGREADSELDIDATVDATCRAGGRLVPVTQLGVVHGDLVILVQEGPSGGHPMLGLVEALLERWRRAGLHFVRYDFQSQIETLRTHPQRLPVALEALAGRNDGCSLLVIAYSTQLVDKRGGSTWLKRIQSWPVRALLDLDPRLDDELSGHELRDALASRVAIDRGDLRRFPFTGDGLECLARYIGSGGRIRISANDRALRPLTEIADALEKWATCLACVPDPSWEQLEDFRRCFNARHFGGQLDDPRYIWRLLEWLRKKRGVPQPIAPDGRSVEISEELLTELLAELKLNDLTSGENLERSAHARLLEHLAAAAPATDYDRGRRALKLIEHRTQLGAAASPGDESSFGDFVGTAFELDVLRLARLTDMQFHKAGQTPPAWVNQVRQAARDELFPGSELFAVRNVPGSLRSLLAAVAAPGAWLAWLGHSVGGSSGALWTTAGAAMMLSSLGALAAAVRRSLPDGDDERRQLLAEASRSPFRPSDASTTAGHPVEWTGGIASAFDALTPRERYARARLRPRPGIVAIGRIGDSPTGEAIGIVQVALADIAPMVFIGLSGGVFTMGSPDDDREAQRRERPQSRRHVPALAIAVTPVTQAQYRAVMGESPSRIQGDHRPVEWVSWDDAVRFCNALSEHDGLPTCYRKDDQGVWIWDRAADGYRLPTETEWEFACRAGTTGAYGFDDPSDNLADYAWFQNNSNGETHDVATKRRNRWGLYDMHGNVWEWCWDWHEQYGADPVVTRDCDGPESGVERVLRGGSFVNEPSHLRSAYRGRAMPTTRVRIHGFRCVRSPRA